MNEFKIGLYSLGDYVSNAVTNEIITEQERMEEIISAAKLADEKKLDIFALGESHQEHFISQAHAVILGAIARETKNILLSSSATIISTSDPVRVYENFATLDILSNGRAEIVAGRASRIGLFSLLGYDVRDYEALFEEKFKLLLHLNNESVINWSGAYRSPLQNEILHPKPLQDKLPIWRAVGGHAQSARVAGMQQVPMMLATLAGPVTHFNQTIEVYRQYFKEYHENLDQMRVGITSFFHVAETDEIAFNRFYKYINYALIQANGHGMNPEVYQSALDIRNAILVGSPETIINKIVYQYEVYRHERHLFQLDLGGMSYDMIEEQINIISKDIMPEVKKRIKAIKERDEK